MIEVDLRKPLAVRTFGFNIPCREFVINAQVSRDKRMPMVDEFVLRAIHLCERVTPARLAAFFGLDLQELEIVLSDLQTRGLILAEENELLLHPSASELFRASPAGTPTILEVEAFPSRVWFDLISQSIVVWQGLHNVRNLVELKSTFVVKDVAVEFARAAFQDNFRDYLQRFRKVGNVDQWHLYAITDVEAGKFSFAQMTGREELDLSPIPRLSSSLDNTEADQPEKIRLLTDAMVKAFSDLVEPEPSISARGEYGKLMDSTPSAATSPDGTTSLERWVELQQGNDATSRSLIGTSYLDRNRRAISGLIPEDLDIPEDSVLPIVWYRPGGTAWGRSEDLQAALADFRSALRQKKSRDITTAMVFPSVTSKETSRRFERLFDSGLTAPAAMLSPAIEVIWIAGIVAVVSVLVELRTGVSVWIGCATSDRQKIQKIGASIPTDLAGCKEVWAPRKAAVRRTGSMG